MPITRNRPLRDFFLPMIAGLAFAASGTWAWAESVVVKFVDDRLVIGEVDDQTDDQRLWLRREEAGVQLSSGYPWDQVQTVWVGQQALSTQAFQQKVATLKTPSKAYLEITPYPALPMVLPQNANCRLAIADDRVQTLHIEARRARWGPGVAADGLQIFVYPVSATGELVPVQGQLDFKLLVQRTSVNGDGAWQTDFQEVEAGSALVRPGDFAKGPAVYQLAFQRFHPDADFNVGGQALVNARLGIPGQGVFEASDANVSLREQSIFRGQLQSHTGKRFWTGENVIFPQQ